MLQRWRVVDNNMSDMASPNLNLRPSAPETNALPLDLLAGLEEVLITQNTSELFRCKFLFQLLKILTAKSLSKVLEN